MFNNLRTAFLGAAMTASLALGAHAETTTYYYPEKDSAMFSIDAPADWKVTAIEEVGDFAGLESPGGSILQFRATKFESQKEAEDEVDAIFDSTGEFLSENYKAVELNEAEKIEGDHPGAKLTGKGKDKDGHDVEFLSAMIVLGPTTIAEVWAAVFPEDKEDLAQANKILDSFTPAAN